ncbi:MAG TPA: winged helix-turn-helix domain-containing protein [Candidatus Elarobacter sp.]|nr:winged helix-turn-helix domain-containing protein [Candidatus Elarobacter sp.]
MRRNVGNRVHGVTIDDSTVFQRPRLTVVADPRDGAGEPDTVLSFAFDVRRASAGMTNGSDIVLLRCARERCEDTVRAFRAMHVVPLVAVVAGGTRADCIRALECGADDVVCEPYDPLELLARLRAVLRRSARGNGGSVQRAGDVELDFVRRQVRRGNAVVALSPTEFNLLACLARNAGRPVPAPELAVAVWGEANRRTMGLVLTYVKYVRDKLAQESRPAVIRTHRGRGYELVG